LVVPLEWPEKTNNFTIKALEIYEIYGKKILYLREENSPQRYNRLLNFQHWSKGTYLLRVGRKGQYVVRKFVID